MLKKVLIVLAVLMLVVIVAVVTLVAVVDVDHYKPRIEQAVHDKLDRTLKFDGKLSLSVFPTIALSLPPTTLSEHGSNAPFLTLQGARVSLALLPLLSGRLQAGTASLYGLRATIEQRADGTRNVDDLMGRSGPKSAVAETPSAPAAGGAPQFELGGIELADAEVVYRDDRSHNTVTVSKLNLRTGRLATRGSTPVDFSASVAATAPASNIDLSLKATVDIDLAAHAFAVRALDAHARGRSAADQFDLSLMAPKVAFSPERTTGEQVKLAASVSGDHQMRSELELDDIAGTGDRLAVGKLTGDLDLYSPALPEKSLKVKLDGSISMNSRAQDIAARLMAHFDETNATLRVDLHGFSAPRIGFDGNVDRLNLDRYLSASAVGSPSEARSAKERAAVKAGAGPGKAEDPKVDLSPLKSLDLSGELQIGALQVHNVKSEKVKIAVKSAGGHLDLAPLSANLYQGALSGSAKVDANTNRVSANLALSNISIEPLVKDLTGRDLIEGHGGVKLDITTAGSTVGAMRHALGGSASLGLHDGAIRGINIAQKLRDVKAALAGGAAQTGAADENQQTDFSELTATFTIKNGVATNNDLQAKSPLLRVNGAGTIDIGAGALDYTVQASVVATPGAQGGGDLAGLRGVTVPVQLSGPFASLSYRLDWNALARQAAKAKVGEQLKNLLGGKLKQGAQTPDQNLSDTLKSLLGK
jgi:AsmA protein